MLLDHMKPGNALSMFSLVIALPLFSGLLSPSQAAGADNVRPTVETLVVESDLVPGQVKVAVLLPPGYRTSDTSFRLLLWLHGGPGDSSYLNRELRPIIEAAWKRGKLPPGRIWS